MENVVILSIEEYQRLLSVEKQYLLLLEEEEKLIEAMDKDMDILELLGNMFN